MFEHRLFNDFLTLLVVIDLINVVLTFMLFTGATPPGVRRSTALRRS
jgi:small neutral amino acid transporter SnatA (MarC family)